MVDRHCSPTGEPLTELALAEDLVAAHAGVLRYVRPWRSWLHFEGPRWARDATGVVERLLKDLLRDKITAALEITDTKQRKATVAPLLAFCAAHRLRDTLVLASTEPEVAVVPDVFDTDPWVFNAANGTIDLRTGALRPHRSTDYLTKLSPTAFAPDARCPRWERFLEEIFDGDREMMAFLARAVGYTLTGLTREECLFLCHGKGQNGKTKLFEALHAVLGPDYARTTAFETFLDHRRAPGAASPDLAYLDGVRFVAASEAPTGHAFDERTLKELTGGDRVPARRLFEDPFEFRPTFKLWLRANHRPPVREQTLAFWRRMRLLPFDVTIPEPRRDLELLAKLTAEAAGILAWAVRGCLGWQREGLGTPTAVAVATAAYRSENDTIGEFLDARCGPEPAAWTATGDLYTAFIAWWDGSHCKHEKPLNRAWFGRLLGERDGFKPEQRGHAKTKGWRGVRLLDGALIEAAAVGEKSDDALPF